MDFHNRRRTLRGGEAGAPGSAEQLRKSIKNRNLYILDCVSYIGTLLQRISLNGEAKKSKKKDDYVFFKI